MFVTVFTFKAKPGQEENVVALHEEWRRTRLAQANGFVSGELLTGVNDPRQFIDIAHFESEAASRTLSNDPRQDAWYRRLVELTEAEPVFTDCTIAHHVGNVPLPL